jgi:peroxiredoxin
MAAKESIMLSLGTVAPPFALHDFNGKLYQLSDFDKAKGLLVAFICYHCPFVQHIRREFAQFAREYQAKGLAVVAIASNDIEAYPQDGLAGMKVEATQFNYNFPYLLDDTQAVAKAYQAACTPDLYLFDSAHRLFYRGQFDASRPRNALPVTGTDLRAATDALLAGLPTPAEQRPSIGCSIKWKPGNAPAYA